MVKDSKIINSIKFFVSSISFTNFYALILYFVCNIALTKTLKANIFYIFYKSILTKIIFLSVFNTILQTRLYL